MSLIAKQLSPDMAGERQKFLLYGEAGTGKTRAAGTAPRPLLFISVGAQNEANTFFSDDFIEAYGIEDIHVAVAEESVGERGQFTEAIGFDTVCDIIDANLKSDIDFKTIVIDNATTLTDMQANKVFEISWDSAKSKDKTALHKLRQEGLFYPSDSDWGGMQSLMNQFISWMFRLDMHVIIVAHEHRDTVTDRASHTQSITAVKPLFVGKQRNLVANLFDNVWRFTKRGQFYEARTQAIDQPYPIIAKTRVGGAVPKDYRDVDITEAIENITKLAGGA